MKENFLHFLSDVPCMLSINGKNIGNIDNSSIMELDVITKTEKIYVTYEPVTNKHQALPYTTLLNTVDKPTTNNENIRIIPFPNNHYDIILSPFYFYQIVDNKVLYNGSVGKYFVSITTDTQTRVIIYSGLTIVFSTTIPIFLAVKVEDNNNNILIQGIIDEDTYYMLTIDTSDFSIVFNDRIHSIDLGKDNISLYQSIGSLCRHAKVCNINLVNKSKEEYYVFEDNTSSNNINPLLIPLAFLQCVKISDEKSAKAFLYSNLQNSNITKMKEYFGDIKDIYFNRHQVATHKLNYTVQNTQGYRNYNFVMDNNKISEIEEVFL
jgi:type VI protein secretion system component Hcp